MTESFKLRGANVRRVSWRSHQSELESLRTIVFIEEQAVPIADEWDGMDDVEKQLTKDVSNFNHGKLSTEEIMPKSYIS